MVKKTTHLGCEWNKYLELIGKVFTRARRYKLPYPLSKGKWLDGCMCQYDHTRMGGSPNQQYGTTCMIDQQYASNYYHCSFFIIVVIIFGFLESNNWTKV